jgi:hypothetical protein
MQNLSVVFLPDPQNPTVILTHVDQDIKIAHPEERINWKFYTADNSIKWVEIDFAGAKFFGDEANPNTQKNWSKKLKKGQAVIWGTVPDATQIKQDKYSIRGYDKDPSGPGVTPVTELDPKIVTAVP